MPIGIMGSNSFGVPWRPSFDQDALRSVNIGKQYNLAIMYTKTTTDTRKA